jgi:hypothetical protein
MFPHFALCYAELGALPHGARRALQRWIARSSDLSAVFPQCLQTAEVHALQRRLARSLAGAALFLALAQGIAQAATIPVTAKARARANVVDGQCSLIEAIVNANADSAVSPDCVAGSGADTIVLPANVNLKLGAVHDNTYGPTGLPLITSPITIDGNGAKIRRLAASPQFRLIAVSKSGDLTLRNVTLNGGYGDNGGGIYNAGGTLTIANSIISGNKSAGFGGGASSNGRWVHIANSTTLHNTLRTGPYCFYYYGIYCYYLYPSTVTITNSTISGNSAQWHGGGLSNYSGTITIENSTISGNKGAGAGGAYNAGGGFVDFYNKYISPGSLSVINSTISKNSAAGYVNYGAAYGGRGGGVFNWNGNLSIENSTLSGNQSNDRGGGLWNNNILSLKRTLISGNSARVGSEIANYGTVTADDFNLFGANGDPRVKGFAPGLTDIVPGRGVGLRKILDRLKNNSGPTKTHALKPGSPALDAVPFTDPGCTGTDQRGVNRPQGTGCDIGAFERTP